MKKKFKIVMLPADEISKMILGSESKSLLMVNIKEDVNFNGFNIRHQHLYILSDGIQEGFGIDKFNQLGKVKYPTGQKSGLGELDRTKLTFFFGKRELCATDNLIDHKVRKIIASTDKSITPNSWIPDSFVEAYIKSYNEEKSITEVQLETFMIKDASYELKTRSDGSVIIVPAEENERSESETTILWNIFFNSIETELSVEQEEKLMAAFNPPTKK